MCIYPIGETTACRSATDKLKARGLSIIDHPSPEVTHLLLDIPSFRGDRQLRCGGCIEPILQMLPPDICIIGGQLDTPCLEQYRKLDLLRNPYYLAKNAAITADCALRLAGQHIHITFAGSQALIIGWGRIGKCLAQLLHSVGSSVSVAVRKASDHAMLEALGFNALYIHEIPVHLNRFDLLFNTVPDPILDVPIPSKCLALELASQSGIPQEHTIDGRGLPGRLAAESSGTLIAETIFKQLQEAQL